LNRYISEENKLRESNMLNLSLQNIYNYYRPKNREVASRKE